MTAISSRSLENIKLLRDNQGTCYPGAVRRPYPGWRGSVHHRRICSVSALWKTLSTSAVGASATGTMQDLNLLGENVGAGGPQFSADRPAGLFWIHWHRLSGKFTLPAGYGPTSAPSRTATLFKNTGKHAELHHSGCSDGERDFLN